jgi:hypothetical protein
VRFIIFTCLLVFLVATPATAQTAVATTDAPVYLQPGSVTPLRTAAAGTQFKVLSERGEWIEVEFNDPQYGRRVGWVRAILLKIVRPETTPIDLSVREDAPPAAGRSQQVSRNRSSSTESRPGYVMGFGGLTFGTETAAAVGGEGGGGVGQHLLAFGEFGHMINVAPKELQDELDNAEQILELITGLDWGFESKVPATYFGGGAKYLMPSSTAMNFYVAGSVGLARIKAEVSEKDFGDVIDDLVQEGYLDEDDVEGTEFYFSVGAGIRGTLGSRGLYDLGYRFIRINEVNISRALGGIGVRF